MALGSRSVAYCSRKKDEAVENIGEGLGRGVGQGLAVLDQGGHQRAQALAGVSRPKAMGRDQLLQRLDQSLGRAGRGGELAITIGRGGAVDGIVKWEAEVLCSCQ